MKILIDNGHGENTPGKRSPDGRFREYKYNHEIARAAVILPHPIPSPRHPTVSGLFVFWSQHF